MTKEDPSNATDEVRFDVYALSETFVVEDVLPDGGAA